ncbi:MAG: hypothetical protein MJ009_00455 [Paludibacteraceae bacterium]|nr:hypothetical protein [Paludibacteraceae bacterium]
MATRVYKWRTAPAYAEGTKSVYVHSATGSDLFGDGTRDNPYQTWGRAFRSGTNPTEIISWGRFSEMMADGNHSCTIKGDYYGAAVFDGAGYYVLYGFRHTNLIIINTGIGEYDLVVNSGSVLYAGVGGAADAYPVGLAGYVFGVAGSSCLIDNSSLYWGVAGGTTAVKYVGFSRPKAGYYKISLGCYSSDTITHDTFYGCTIENRTRKVTSSFKCASSVFGLWDMFADESAEFTQVLFAKDCNWYYKDILEDSSLEDLKIVIDTLSESEEATFVLGDGTMTIGGGGVTDIPSAIAALYAAGRITSKPTFTSCIFSEQNSSDIFNNPTKQDLTLKNGSDAIISPDAYYGCLPPCLNVPIMENSDGVAETWDEKSADGLLMVNSDDEICIDEASMATEGSIRSKIIRINPANTMMAGIYSAYADKFADYGCALWSEGIVGQEYEPGDVLPVGRYLVKGAIVYNNSNFENRSVIVVSEENTTFANDNVESTLLQLIDANISDVVYVRALATIYKKIKQGDGLQRGATYLNCGNSNITYRTRTIVPGESFIAVNAIDDFSATDPEYEIGIMFDDTRVPSSEWIPAQLFGEFFVVKESGTVKEDVNGIPVSSGNYLAWQGTANGGYSASRRNSIKQQYFQFMFVIQCVYDSIN